MDSTTHAPQASSSSPSPKRNLLRLAGLRTAQLPSETATPDELKPFLAQLLREGLPFISSASPSSSSSSSSPAVARNSHSSPWKPKGKATKTPAGCSVSVDIHLSERQEEEEEEETWIARRSLHADDDSKKGTASWHEFVACLRDAHAQTEKAFTPTVVDAREVVEWKAGCEGVVVEVEEQRWGRFSLAVHEMRHKIGRPVLKDRVFPVLQMSCTRLREGKEEQPEFLVVSVTIPDLASHPSASLSRAKGVVIGAYASVEWVRRLPEQQHATVPGQQQTEWIMATASNANGVLPTWVQTLAIPSQIVKDVPLFLGWLAQERERAAAGESKFLGPQQSSSHHAREETEEVGGEGRGRGHKQRPREGTDAASTEEESQLAQRVVQEARLEQREMAASEDLAKAPPLPSVAAAAASSAAS